MRKHILVLAITACAVTPGWAQEIPVYEETGTVNITLGDKQITHYTTWNTVPGDSERQVHTASWVILKPMLMGGVNMIPDDVFVTITSRDTVKPKSEQTSMRVEFSLDPVTLDLKPDSEPTILYYPYSREADGYYAMTNGSFDIEKVTKIDANSFAISGSAQGEMTAQKNATIAHNPEDVLPFKAQFELQKVVNRSDIPLP